MKGILLAVILSLCGIVASTHAENTDAHLDSTGCDTFLFQVRIESVRWHHPRTHTFVNVVLDRGIHNLGSFEFYISFDSALTLAGVTPGPAWFNDTAGCGWEYFAYRYYDFGQCGDACASGEVKVIAIASIDPPFGHPSCYIPPILPSTIFTLDFVESGNAHSDNRFWPLRFVWEGCGANGFSDRSGDTEYISRNVYDADRITNIADSNGTYPTWNGDQQCDSAQHLPHLIRAIDFVNGGIDFEAYDSGCICGDIDLNGVRNELSDAVLFANYFQYGPRVFTINRNGQTNATEVNRDGNLLTLSDFVYLEGIIADILPDSPKHIPPTISAKYTVDVGKVSVDTTVAAAFLIAKGHVVPTLLARNMDMTCHFDSNTTRILIYTDPHRYSIRSFTGTFVDGIDSLISIEFASPQGGMVEAQRDTMIQALNSYSVRIERTRDTYQGGSQSVDVILEKGRQPLGGFDFLMAYETNALLLTSVTPGTDWVGAGTGCEWEYFTYRYSEFGTCGSACASGKVRVVALADLNSQPDHHPLCGIPSELPSTLFTLNFRVSDNRTFECAFLPVRFVWFDCNDNLLYNPSGDTMFISRTVLDTADAVNIADSLDSYPTFKGTQRCNAILPQRYHPIRGIDFKNGGIQIGCDWMLESRGDLDLNNISNEIADVTMFCDYFLHGLGAFRVNVQGQIATSDVNYDDKPLTVADLVYECRVVVGDANPYPRTAPPTMEAHYTVANGKLSIDSLVAAAVIDVQGDVTPTLLASNMNMLFSFDGANTHILIYTDPSRLSLETFCGAFLSVTGTVLSAEFATPQGGMVTASRIESGLQEFILGQNYPNPFNPTTRISFSLPAAVSYTLAIYNIAGQKVYETSSLGAAGINAVDWTASHEASGIYFYKLTSGNISETKKMIFLK